MFGPWVKKIYWRREWQPAPVFLPGKSHGRRILVGYSPWGHKESDRLSDFTSCGTQLYNHRIFNMLSKLMLVKTISQFIFKIIKLRFREVHPESYSYQLLIKAQIK